MILFIVSLFSAVAGWIIGLVMYNLWGAETLAYIAPVLGFCLPSMMILEKLYRRVEAEEKAESCPLKENLDR